jgi:hypothetical protein
VTRSATQQVLERGDVAQRALQVTSDPAALLGAGYQPSCVGEMAPQPYLGELPTYGAPRFLVERSREDIESAPDLVHRTCGDALEPHRSGRHTVRLRARHWRVNDFGCLAPRRFADALVSAAPSRRKA